MFSAIATAKIVILTGAGASVPLGRHTTKQFLDDFCNQGYQRLLDAAGPEATTDVDFIRGQAGRGQDIEDVLSLVERKRDAADLLLTDVFFCSQVLPGNQGHLLAYRGRQAAIADTIYDEVIAHYGGVNAQQAADLYRELLSGFPAWFRDVPELGYTLPFFTLNYDTAVEAAAACLRDAPDMPDYRAVHLIDGLVEVRGASERRWSREAFTQYEEDPEKANVVLLKLHGSVRWGRRETQDGDVIVELSPSLPRDPRPYAHAVLYPTLAPKPTAIEPFRTGYQCFRACLRTAGLLAVIGTSFRDPEVKAELRDALEANERLRVAVIDPQAKHEEIARRLATDAARIGAVRVEFRTPLHSMMGCLRAFARVAFLGERSHVKFGATFGPEVLADVPWPR